MTYVRYEPWNVVERLHRHIEQLFTDQQNKPANGETASTWTPLVDVHEEADKYLVRADLPGVEIKDIQITADKGVLTLSGERHSERSDNEHGFVRIERSDGQFLRRFTLPDNVQTDNIRARQVNGVLEVTIPKVPSSEPRRVVVETH